jgi:PRC-barrel domain protein
MRASELIGCQVYDADGQAIGTVHDLHFRVNVRPDGIQACQLDILECGGVGLGHRLGYGEHAMTGPWPLPALFRYLANRSLAVPWSQVTAFDRPRIDISARRAQLQRAREVRK